MPRFFVDTSDGDNFVRDETGFDFADIKVARDAAVRALPSMAKDVLPRKDQHTFFTIVRDEAGNPLLHATLVLSITSLMPERES